RRLLLVGAVGAPQSLDGGVGAPAGLEQVMDALALIAACKIGVIAAPGPAGVGEDENALVVIHEGGGLGIIGRGRAVLNAETIATADNTLRSAGDFGDKIGAEAVQDLIKRALHRRQGGKMFDHPVAAFDRLARNDGIAVGIKSRARLNISVGV